MRSRLAGSASSRSSVISPLRWPITTSSPADFERYANRSVDPTPHGTPSSLSWYRARRCADWNGTIDTSRSRSPASTSTQLGHNGAVGPTARQLHAHVVRLLHGSAV